MFPFPSRYLNSGCSTYLRTDVAELGGDVPARVSETNDEDLTAFEPGWLSVVVGVHDAAGEAIQSGVARQLRVRMMPATHHHSVHGDVKGLTRVRVGTLDLPATVIGKSQRRDEVMVPDVGVQVKVFAVPAAFRKGNTPLSVNKHDTSGEKKNSGQPHFFIYLNTADHAMVHAGGADKITQNGHITCSKILYSKNLLLHIATTTKNEKKA